MPQEKQNNKADGRSRLHAVCESSRTWFTLLVLVIFVAVRGLTYVVSAYVNAGWLTLNQAGDLPHSFSSAVLAQSETTLRRALTLGHNNRSAWHGLGLALAAQGREQEAVAAWKSAGGMDQVLISYGEKARKAKRYDEAIQWYDRAAELMPALNSRYFYLRSLALDAMDENKRSVDDLAQAIALDRGWPDWEARFMAWLTWGEQLITQQNWSGAENALREAVEVHNNMEGEGLPVLRSEAYRLLGLAQWQQQELATAVENMRQAVSWNEHNVWAHVHLGKTLYLLDPQRVNDVEKEFVYALELQSQDVELYANLMEFWRWVEEDNRLSRLCDVARKRFGNLERFEDMCSSS